MRSAFNRTILECKSIYKAILFFIDISFNRTILECKSRDNAIALTHIELLIEPYWNVNTENNKPDTKGTIAFNRTILECKFY